MPQIQRQSTTEDDENDSDSATHQGSDPNLRLWLKNELISLQDDDGDAFAHGYILDGEPELAMFENNHLVDDKYVHARWWVKVKITSVVNSKINLPTDCCFDASGGVLKPCNLFPKALQEQVLGIVIWHQYIVQRQLAPKVYKRTSTPILPCFPAAN